MTTGSLAKIYNMHLPMRRLLYSHFAIQTGKLDARLILSGLLFPYPTITKNSTEQKYCASLIITMDWS